MSSRTHCVWAVALLLAACNEDDYVQLYKTAPRAPSLTEQDLRDLEHLGPKLVDQGANFCVYSENATRVELLLFDDPERDLPTRRVLMTRFEPVWNVYVEGVGLGQHYGYIAWGPNWPYVESWYPGAIDGFKADVDAEGNRFDPNKLLFDPYSRALHRDHDWGKGSTASGPARTVSTWAAASKSVIVASEYQWSANEAAWRAKRKDATWHESIVYEVHPKGFTASPASEVKHPGTYRGLGEKADYFADLGVTAVELLPVFEKPLDGGYWGYQTINFFAAERTFASQNQRNQVIDEFKWMVDQLHQRGLEVWLDVVYNHTGEGGLWREKIEQDDVSVDPRTTSEMVKFDPKEIAGLYSYRGLDNRAYYALSKDNQTYWNNTGVGNETRCNNRPMRRLILDSLRYWVEEMHVDGFRFDLAPVLGEKDLEYNTWDDPKNTVLQEILEDPVLSKYQTRVVAEPWSLAHFKLGGFPVDSKDSARGWYEWNGHFRDAWRAFVNFDGDRLNTMVGPVDIGGTLTGSSPLFSWNGRRPYHSMNFVTVHDGFPMYDLFSYDQKRNGCGLLNPVCCSSPMSAFCNKDDGESNNRSKDWGQQSEPLKRQLMRNLFVAMMIAHGTPLILGGDEWMRTQYGNNNAYSTGADNNWNWFDWGTWQPANERQRMRDFVRQLTRFRRARTYALAPPEYSKTAPFAWKNAANQDMQAADWGQKQVMQHYYDPKVGPELLVLINMESSKVDFQLPAGRSWKRLIDTQSYFDEDVYFVAPADPKKSANITLDAPEPVPGASYGAMPRSIVVLEAKP